MCVCVCVCVLVCVRAWTDRAAVRVNEVVHGYARRDKSHEVLLSHMGGAQAAYKMQS